MGTFRLGLGTSSLFLPQDVLVFRTSARNVSCIPTYAFFTTVNLTHLSKQIQKLGPSALPARGIFLHSRDFIDASRRVQHRRGLTGWREETSVPASLPTHSGLMRCQSSGLFAENRFRFQWAASTAGRKRLYIHAPCLPGADRARVLLLTCASADPAAEELV